MSKSASGFPDHVRNDVLLLGVRLDVLLDHAFPYQQGPAGRALLRHLRPSVFFFPTQGIIKEGDTRRLAQAWLPPPCALRSFHQYVLVCSSSIPPLPWPTPGEVLLSFLPSHSRRACPTSLVLFSSVLRCMKEVSPDRHVLEDSGVFVCLSAVAAPWLLSRGPLGQAARRNSQEASLSSMSGNLGLLRGQRLATNTCNSCPSIPLTFSASLTPQFLFLTFPDKRQTPLGSSQPPRQRLTFSTGHFHPSQVSAPFVP